MRTKSHLARLITWAVVALFTESYMNVSQYSPNKKMEHEAIGPLDSMPLISELMREAGVPGQRRLAPEESFVRTCRADVSGATLSFGVDEAGCAHLTRCTTTAAEVSVPAEVEGSVVTAIGPLAFKGCASLERIELPDTLHTIGRRAFQGTRLASLYIPENLRTVGSAAFYTGGAITRNYKPTIREVRVAPGNDRFYVEEETFCQRGEDGDTALLHVGAGKRMVVPANVTHIGAFAFMRADRVDQVVMHDGVKSIDLGGLDLARGVSALVYEQRGDDPRRYVVRYPLGELGRQTLRITLSHGGFDIALAFLECDRSITHVSDTYIRSRMMLDRLAESVYLYERMEALFRNRLETGICQSTVAFGRNGYLEGVDRLLVCEVALATGERDAEVVREARALGNSILAAPSRAGFEAVLDKLGFAVKVAEEPHEVQPNMGFKRGHEAPVAPSAEQVAFEALVLHATKSRTVTR